MPGSLTAERKSSANLLSMWSPSRAWREKGQRSAIGSCAGRQPLGLVDVLRGVSVLAHAGVPLHCLRMFAFMRPALRPQHPLFFQPRPQGAANLFGGQDAVSLLQELHGVHEIRV